MDQPSAESASTSREAILTMLEETMTSLHEQIEATDPQTPDEEDLQLRRTHELGYLANQFRKLKRDTDIDEMEDELELLHAAKDLEDA